VTAPSLLHRDALCRQVTPARRRALEVLAEHGYARESNNTHVDANGAPCIYWQSRAWLSREGLIRCQLRSRGSSAADLFAWVLTETGRQLCRDLDIELA
jgi:hypothetical protein